MKISLDVNIGKLKLKNPVIAASGTFGPEYGELVDINILGAFIAKTITLKPRMGNPAPRIVETASGMLNSIGLENKGLEDFIKSKLPELGRVRTPLIASIAGDDEDEYRELAKKLNRLRQVSGIEVNLSCPNVKHGSRNCFFAQEESGTYQVVRAVRRATRKTIIAKLSPNVTDIGIIAKAAESAGADAVSLVNTFLGLAVDIETRRPMLGNITGGLSGPAIKPIALRMVREVYKKVGIPVIGMGGIMDYRDAVEFILCGATAVQVGTANFVNPRVALEIADGLKRYLSSQKTNDINKMVGGMSC